MITLLDELGIVVPPENGRWTVEEARRYQVRGARVVRGESGPLPALGDTFVLQVGHQVGRIQLEWETGSAVGTATLEVVPRAEKLSPELWLSLVQDLEAWLPTVTVGMDGARHGAVGTVGVSSGWLAEALLPLVPLLLRATADLTGQLRVRTVDRLEDQPLRAARQARRETLAWVSRHPSLAQWLDGWAASDLHGRPPDLPLRRTYDALDHPANRYIHWLLDRVGARLNDVAARLRRVSGDEAVTAWCAARAAGLEEAGVRIDTLVGRSPLRHIAPAPPTEAAMSVVLDDPLYSRVYGLARRFLSPRFALADSDTPASVRPSYGIYELWCLLAVERTLGTLEGFRWSREHYARLLGETGGGARLTGRSAVGDLEVRFNHTFVGYGARVGNACWSLSGERRPDFVVSWRTHGGDERAWLVMDAKYRVGANLVDAFSSIHLYRDALRWDTMGGPARAGVLLTPARTVDTLVYFEADFRQEHRMGAFEVNPNAPGSALRDWITATLGAR